MDPEWEWAQELLELRRERLLSIRGVVGCGLGFKFEAGEETGEPCITVYVARKLRPETLDKRGITRIPSFVRSEGKRLSVDVVELGRLKRHALGGASFGPELNPSRGTLGCFAIDTATSELLGLTAMHVSGFKEFNAAGSAPVFFTIPSRLENDNAPRAGLLRRGTMSGVDAAKVALLPGQKATPEIEGIGKIRGWRPTTFPGDRHIVVRMFGARSKLQHGVLVNPAISLPDDQLDVAILVDIASVEGDSGAALVDPENFVLGFLVGAGGSRLNDLRVFTPASLVLNRLQCDVLVASN